MTNIGMTNKLILAFVTLLLGIILIGSMASEGITKTSLTGVSSEEHEITILDNVEINTTAVYTLTNAPTGWRVEGECPISSLVISNQSGSALTLTTDYIPDLNAGTFVLVNNSDTVGLIGIYNKTYVDYQYCGDGYMNLGWGRTSINLVPGFFAIALLLISLGLFYSIGKELNII